LNWPTGLLVEGGKGLRSEGLHVANASTIADLTAVANSAAIVIGEAATDGGTYQPAWTLRFSNLTGNAGYRTQCFLFVSQCDGLQISNGYFSGGKEEIVRFKNLRAGSGIASVTITNVYIDAIDPNTGATTCVGIPNDGLASYLYNVSLNNCFIGNCVGDAIVVAKRTTEFQITGGVIANVSGTGLNYSGDAANTGGLQVTGVKFQNTGTDGGASSAVRIGNALSVNFTGNKIDSHSGSAAVLLFDGAIADAVVSGNTFRVSGTDFQGGSNAFRLSISGNTSLSSPSNVCGYRPGNSANSDTKVLDWYEESTFTPTIRFGGAAVGVVYVAQIGRFTRIGNMVQFDLLLQLSSKGSSTGNIQILGLPYTTARDTPVSLRITNITAGVANEMMMAFAVGSTANLRLDKIASGTTFAVQLTDADVENTLTLHLAGSYAV
jgi:hypothetical protein